MSLWAAQSVIELLSITYTSCTAQNQQNTEKYIIVSKNSSEFYLFDISPHFDCHKSQKGWYPSTNFYFLHHLLPYSIHFSPGDDNSIRLQGTSDWEPTENCLQFMLLSLPCLFWNSLILELFPRNSCNQP